MAQAALLLWAASLPYCTGWLYHLPKFTRVSRFLAAAQIFTISCEKILSRLLSVLSLRRKFVHDHCCCPNSAIILTDSKMEAILDFGRGCQNLSIILWGGGGGKGTLVSAPPPAQAMRVQIAPGHTAANLVLLSIQCPFPFPPPFSVLQRLDSSR
jgi:hypothetical protein